MKLLETLAFNALTRSLGPWIITESVSFGEMQKAIYAYVLKTMKNVPSDAKSEAENDRFWVEDFDYAHEQLTKGNIDALLDALSSAIVSVSESIVDHYGDAANHEPGYKPIKLNAIESVSDKDLLSIINVLDPKMIEKDLEEKKKSAEEAAAYDAKQKKHASERIKDVATVLKKYEHDCWKEFLRVVKLETGKKRNGRLISLEYFPPGTTEEQISNIKTEEDLKSIFTKPKDLIDSLTNSMTEIPNYKDLTDDENYLVGLGYVIARDAALSKKLAALIK